MDPLIINGRQFPVDWELSPNRTANARLKEGRILIKIPKRWSMQDREKIGGSLLRRVIKAIESGKWDPTEEKAIAFHHGQRFSILGREYRVEFVHGPSLRAKVEGDRIIVRDPQHPLKSDKADKLIKRRLIEQTLPTLSERVSRLNDEHFNAKLGRLTLRENRTRWGSCSPDGSISLDMRLLFLPEAVLDYVIVHELAHTRYRGHGKRFWGLVERAVPDHKERRKWLREESSRHIRELLSRSEPQRSMTDFLA